MLPHPPPPRHHPRHHPRHRHRHRRCLFLSLRHGNNVHHNNPNDQEHHPYQAYPILREEEEEEEHMQRHPHRHPHALLVLLVVVVWQKMSLSPLVQIRWTFSQVNPSLPPFAHNINPFSRCYPLIVTLPLIFYRCCCCTVVVDILSWWLHCSQEDIFLTIYQKTKFE